MEEPTSSTLARNCCPSGGSRVRASCLVALTDRESVFPRTRFGNCPGCVSCRSPSAGPQPAISNLLMYWDANSCELCEDLGRHYMTELCR
jgi:hypothetical protein